ncbi:MOSC domain-containing protein [Marinagarivorans algicola]|uniref:MOSC domain-containing protein n=1 Tax=Marinagarivorans algicola TaxID=1513270 RepID=UPI0006B9A893|nr:MOSC N-terminal beta barrel domain-containing protein [Marinagarivorans algicola]
MTLSASTAHITTTIESLWIYPVKSLAGIALTQCEITPHGLKGDRQWMIVDDQGLFVSQRKLPVMGLIKTHLEPDNTLTLSIDEEISATKPAQTATVKRSISLHPDECQTPCRTWVWQDECPAREAPTTVNAWLNHQLQYKKPVRLVYFDKTGSRPQDTARFGDNTPFFADAAPLLLCNSTSLQALNRALQPGNTNDRNGDDDLTMERFRPNIVIATQTAFDEHDYTRGSIELEHHAQAQAPITDTTIDLQLIDHCQRCSMITLNPRTAKSQKAVALFDALSRLNPMPNNPKAPAFGVNCTIDMTNQSTPPTLKQGAAFMLSR